MNFLDLLGIEFMKVKRSKIVPLIFIAPLLVVASGVAALSRYFTPEYTNASPVRNSPLQSPLRCGENHPAQSRPDTSLTAKASLAY